MHKLFLSIVFVGLLSLVACGVEEPEEVSCIDGKPICEKASEACECAIKCITPPPLPPPPKKPVAIIILDLSGSMKDPIYAGASKSKIDDAKKVIKDVVGNIKHSSIELGLVALGHKQAGCKNNVELLISPEGENNDLIIKSLDGLQAKGETPLSEAVLIAGEILLEKKKMGHTQLKIILVSDGEESCEGDPVNVVRNLKDSRLDFIFHAIGFGTDEATNEVLQQLVTLGDGELFTPSDEKELRRDLTKAVNGIGSINISKLEDRDIQGWKLFDQDEVVLQVNGSKSSRDRLWIAQSTLVGEYDFCLYKTDAQSGMERAYAQKVRVEANHLTTVDSIELINSLEQ